MEIRKIAIVSSSFAPFSGGVSSAHYNLYRKLKKRGFNVRVFTNGDPDHTKMPDVVKRNSPRFFQRLLGISISIYFRLKGDRHFRRQLHHIFDSCWASLTLRQPIRRFQPDVLIVPDISAPAFFIGKVPNCRTILIAHHNPMRFLDNPLIRLHSELDAILAMRIEQRGLRNIDKVLCPSKYMKEAFEKTYQFNRSVAVVPNIFDEEILSSLPPDKVHIRCGLSEEAVVVYMPSAGSEIKGAKYVYEIVRRLFKYCSQQSREIGFYLSGVIAEDLRYELQHLDAKAKIFAPGKVSYEENLALIKSCSFAITPTLLESFGMAILEANFCGLPVVTFNCGGNEDIIQNGENGFIVPYLDMEGLISRAQQLCHDALRKKMRKKSLAIAHEKFNSDLIVDEYLKEILP